MVVIGRLLGRHESELVELDGVAAAGVDVGQRLGERLAGPRR